MNETKSFFWLKIYSVVKENTYNLVKNILVSHGITENKNFRSACFGMAAQLNDAMKN